MRSNTYYLGLSIIGVLVLLLIMLHHPHGGDIVSIASRSGVIYLTHIPAICALTLLSLGIIKSFSLFSGSVLAELGRIVFYISFFCGFLGACFNGIVLPIFLNNIEISDKSDTNINTIVIYNTVLNTAFESIFILSFTISILIFSIANFRFKIFPAWITWYGILICAIILVFLIAGFNFLTIFGFMIFILIFSSWCLANSYLLSQHKE